MYLLTTYLQIINRTPKLILKIINFISILCFIYNLKQLLFFPAFFTCSNYFINKNEDTYYEYK